jgi:hypothetical protein
MPLIIAALWGAFYSMIGALVGRVIIALGLGVISYTGVSVTLGWLKSKFAESAAALPADVLGMMAMMKIGETVSIIMSAIIVRLVLDGLTGDTMKRWVTK